MSLVETTDAVLEENAVGQFDIQIDADGDILTKDFWDTSLLMSIFCEKRALASEQPISRFRRGWIGNEETPDFEIGSKLWLLYQAKKTQDTLNDIVTYIQEATQWLVTDGFAISIDVVASFTQEGAFASITIFRPNSKVEKRFYELWNNTGQP